MRRKMDCEDRRSWATASPPWSSTAYTQRDEGTREEDTTFSNLSQDVTKNRTVIQMSIAESLPLHSGNQIISPLIKSTSPRCWFPQLRDSRAGRITENLMSKWYSCRAPYTHDVIWAVQQPCKAGIFTPILQMRKPRPSWAIGLAQDHLASRLTMLAAEPMLFQIPMPGTFQSKKLNFILGLVSEESNTGIQLALRKDSAMQPFEWFTPMTDKKTPPGYSFSSC